MCSWDLLYLTEVGVGVFGYNSDGVFGFSVLSWFRRLGGVFEAGDVCKARESNRWVLVCPVCGIHGGLVEGCCSSWDGDFGWRYVCFPFVQCNNPVDVRVRICDGDFRAALRGEFNVPVDGVVGMQRPFDDTGFA